MEPLIKKLNSLNTASDNAIEPLKKLFVKTEIKKGLILDSTPWQPASTLFYFPDGLIRGMAEHNGISYPLWVKDEGFIIPSYGFLTGLAFGETIEVMRNTKAFALNLFRVDRIAQQNTDLYKMLMEIYEENLMDCKRRQLMYLIKDAGERLAYFTEYYPRVAQILTNDQVADLLRINRKYFYSVVNKKKGD